MWEHLEREGVRLALKVFTRQAERLEVEPGWRQVPDLNLDILVLLPAAAGSRSDHQTSVLSHCCKTWKLNLFALKLATFHARTRLLTHDRCLATMFNRNYSLSASPRSS